METRIITFPSVWHAFRAEKTLQAASIEVSLIPVPRELSSSCHGLAARVAPADIERALSLLDKELVSTELRGATLSI